jgi:hypothetical protein
MNPDVKMVVETLEALVLKINELHGPIHDANEGYGLLLEEQAELLDEVRHKELSWRRVGQEAVDVACVAVRMCGGGGVPLKHLVIKPLHSLHQGFGLLSKLIFQAVLNDPSRETRLAKDILSVSLSIAVFAKKRC